MQPEGPTGTSRTTGTIGTTRTTASGDEALRLALGGALQAIEANFEVVDELNVFPVPDGDTGSNLLATVRPGIQALLANPSSVQESAERLERHFTADSRGNSGFIVSVFFAALLARVAESGVFGSAELVAGVQAGHFAATTALSDPREGTMLTAMRHMSAALAAANPGTLDEALEVAEAAAREGLQTTPALLPILRRAGVIDSGALGLCVLVGGMRRGLVAAPVRVERAEEHRFAPDPSVEVEEDGPLRFRYCTEVRIDRAAGEGEPVGAPALRDWLAARGDSLALVADETHIKVHVHTNEPEEVIDWLRGFGAEASRKIEDMQAQVDARAASMPARPGAGSAGSEPALVAAIVPGAGFGEVFRELGASHVLVCAERLPSAQEVEDFLATIPAGPVLLLANDKNLFGSAELALRSLERPVTMLRSPDVIAGIGAMYLWTPGAGRSEAASAMSDGFELALSVGICRSVSARTYGATRIEAGDYFAVVGEDVPAAGRALDEVLIAALLRVAGGDRTDGGEARGPGRGLGERSVLTLYRGRDADGIDEVELSDSLRRSFPQLEIEFRPGGQRRTLLLAALE